MHVYGSGLYGRYVDWNSSCPGPNGCDRHLGPWRSGHIAKRLGLDLVVGSCCGGMVGCRTSHQFQEKAHDLNGRSRDGLSCAT